MSNTFSIDQDINGVLVISREPLGPPSALDGGVTVSPSGIYEITRTSSPKFGRMQRLEAVCIATGVAPGFFQLRSSSVPTTSDNIRNLHVGISTPGTRFVWEFPTPLSSIRVTQPFSVEVPTLSPSIGTWFFTAEGYYTTVPQD